MSQMVINPFRFAEDGGGGSEKTGITTVGNITGGSTGQTRSWGWIFEVGGSDITVVALRAYGEDGASHTFDTTRLWRVSDEMLLATATTVVTGGEWTETPITPVALSAGASYAIVTGNDATGGAYTRSVDVPSFAFASEISYVTGTRTDSGDPDEYPGGALANEIYGLSDIVFTV